MKPFIKKYRGIIILALALAFNYFESIIFGAGTEIGFNHKPMSKAEYISDLISEFFVLFGFWLAMKDIYKPKTIIHKHIKMILQKAEDVEPKVIEKEDDDIDYTKSWPSYIEVEVNSYEPKPGDTFKYDEDSFGTVTKYVHDREWYFRLPKDDTVWKSIFTPSEVKWISREENNNDKTTGISGNNPTS